MRVVVGGDHGGAVVVVVFAFLSVCLECFDFGHLVLFVVFLSSVSSRCVAYLFVLVGVVVVCLQVSFLSSFSLLCCPHRRSPTSLLPLS